MLTHGPRQAHVWLIFDVRHNASRIVTAKKRVLFSLTLSLVLVVVAYAVVQKEGNYLAWVLFPGIMVDLVASGNVHLGFGGALGVAVTSAVSTFVWFFVAFGVFSLVSSVARRLRKKNDKPA